MSVALHFNDTLAGRVFSQSVTPLGLALPIYTATALCASGICGLPIWNPPNSNRQIELISLDVPWVSGTAGIGTIGLMGLPLLGIATGAPVTAFATTVPLNGFLGAGNTTKVSSSNGASAVTATAGTAGAPTALAPGWIRSLMSINLENSTTTPEPTGLDTYIFNGTVCIPPGYMVYFACTVATVALFGSTVIWKEIPINAAAG